MLPVLPFRRPGGQRRLSHMHEAGEPDHVPTLPALCGSSAAGKLIQCNSGRQRRLTIYSRSGDSIRLESIDDENSSVHHLNSHIPSCREVDIADLDGGFGVVTIHAPADPFSRSHHRNSFVKES
jgi:hypothetical protein